MDMLIEWMNTVDVVAVKDKVLESIKLLAMIGVSVLIFAFTVMEAVWPINDEPTPWFHKLTCFGIGGVILTWMWW